MNGRAQGTGLDVEAVADVAARVVVRLWEEKRRTVEARHYGMKAIRKAVAETATVPIPSENTIRQWTRHKRFPLSEGPLGLFVTQWELERWALAWAPART